MNKAEFLRALDEENRQWEALLASIGENRMEQPGVAGHWSIKDIVAQAYGGTLAGGPARRAAACHHLARELDYR